MSKKQFTHISKDGNPQMVNVSEKRITIRTARAQAIVDVGDEILAKIQNNELITKKGPVFQTAIIAGVLGAKRTAELIPFCHPLGLEDCQIKISVAQGKIVIDTEAVVTAKTGVSKGKFDFIPEVFEELGVKKLFHHVNQRPGKPFWFGKSREGKTVFALPGNPVSTYMCFYRYIKPWILRSLHVETSVLTAALAENFSFGPQS